MVHSILIRSGTVKQCVTEIIDRIKLLNNSLMTVCLTGKATQSAISTFWNYSSCCWWEDSW